MKRIRRTRLTTSQEKPTDYLKDRLAPLARGKSVKLTVNYSAQSGRKQREVSLLLLLTPGELYGMPKGTVVASVVGKGSSILLVKDKTGIAGLMKSGVPAKLAIALRDKLKEIYGD